MRLKIPALKEAGFLKGLGRGKRIEMNEILWTDIPDRLIELLEDFTTICHTRTSSPDDAYGYTIKRVDSEREITCMIERFVISCQNAPISFAKNLKETIGKISYNVYDTEKVGR